MDNARQQSQGGLFGQIRGAGKGPESRETGGNGEAGEAGMVCAAGEIKGCGSHGSGFALRGPREQRGRPAESVDREARKWGSEEVGKWGSEKARRRRGAGGRSGGR
ncbi:hypothetical protein SLA_1549 [Streptomyces laurentii]|uniref:Uncharacterized protein n=1 Tax=Streptomyces laurentii TaxID=39478 RepID=A0A160NV43_STRLU|nr:hypothetical protein SLA_1549 [Streptomyces laurentii]